MNKKRLDPERQAMALAFAGDVRNLAFAFARRNARDVPPGEIVSDAMVGLVYAAAMFDPSHGVPFPSFAKMVVRQAMVRAAHRWRRWGHAGQGEEVDTVDERPHVVTDPDAARLVDLLRRILPANVFDLLSQHHIDGLTLTEIGRRRGLSRARIGQLCEKGREQARKILPTTNEA